jgi:hypothetical protein
MSSIPPRGVPVAYDEAEKGTLDHYSGPASISALELAKKVNHAIASAPDVAPASNTPVTRLPARKKKKVSKWTLWTLWFNTYR